MGFLEEVLYPAHCVACEQPGAWLCAACTDSIPFFNAPLLTPGLPSGRERSLPLVFAASTYAHKPWSTLITSIKYEGLAEAEEAVLACLRMYREALGVSWIFGEGDGWTLVPIPTSPDHLEERGRDHMDVWLRAVQALLPNAPVRRDLLLRRSGTVAHASLIVPGAREAEMQNTVHVSGPVPQRVLLLDDVYTTGATMQACASALKEAGVQAVEAFTAAASFSPR